MTKRKDFAAIAEQYCRDVVEGRIYTARWTRLSCQRHLNDLARQGTPGFPYRFDAATANKFGRFCETFHVFEGPLTGKHIDLMPWQAYVFGSLMGWTCDGGPRDGKRRFRRAVIEMPRGNSKSTMGSLLALWMLACDGEGGAQCVSAGTSRDVAKISWGAAAEMARREPAFSKAIGIDVLAHSIVQRRTASRFNPISADAKTSDGKNLHFCLFDEAWAFKTRTLYDSLETGTAKRDNSLMLVIGTAGFDTASVAFELRTYLGKILDGSQIDESTWGVIYCIPEDREADWHQEDVWQAANPGYGRMVMPEIISQLAEKAKAMPSAKASFVVKHLCQWVSSNSPWIDMTRWNALADPTLSIDDFAGEPCYVAYDLSRRTDICAKTYMFPKSIDGNTHYFIFSKPYLPELAIETGKNSQYRGWADAGHIEVCPGEVIDYSMLEDDLFADCRKFAVQYVGFDPWNAAQFGERMLSEGVPMTEIRQTVQNFSEPMKSLEALTLQGRIHHNGDPVMTWCVGNVEVKPDNNDNIYPRKGQNKDRKTDVAQALIMAAALALEYGLTKEPESFVSFV